jgi:hypothetical protein
MPRSVVPSSSGKRRARPCLPIVPARFLRMSRQSLRHPCRVPSRPSAAAYAPTLPRPG